MFGRPGKICITTGNVPCVPLAVAPTHDPFSWRLNAPVAWPPHPPASAPLVQPRHCCGRGAHQRHTLAPQRDCAQRHNSQQAQRPTQQPAPAVPEALPAATCAAATLEHPPTPAEHVSPARAALLQHNTQTEQGSSRGSGTCCSACALTGRLPASLTATHKGIEGNGRAHNCRLARTLLYASIFS